MPTPAPASGTAGAAAILHRDLVAAADPARARSERAYLRHAYDEHLGVSVPVTRRIVRDWARREQPSTEEALAVAGALWASPVFDDRRAAAAVWELEAVHLGPEHLDELAAMVADARTWALVDPLAHTVAGTVLAAHPEAAGVVERWSVDPSFWVRRLSVLALSRPVRAGSLPFARVARVADRLIDEREFFVRKAIGWVLRDLARDDPDAVAAWCRPRMDRMSGVTWREARKRLPAEAVAELEAGRVRPG